MKGTEERRNSALHSFAKRPFFLFSSSSFRLGARDKCVSRRCRSSPQMSCGKKVHGGKGQQTRTSLQNGQTRSTRQQWSPPLFPLVWPFLLEVGESGHSHETWLTQSKLLHVRHRCLHLFDAIGNCNCMKFQTTTKPHRISPLERLFLLFSRLLLTPFKSPRGRRTGGKRPSRRTIRCRWSSTSLPRSSSSSSNSICKNKGRNENF